MDIVTSARRKVLRFRRSYGGINTSANSMADLGGLLVAVQVAALGMLVSINTRLAKHDERLSKVEAKFELIASILGHQSSIGAALGRAGGTGGE